MALPNKKACSPRTRTGFVFTLTNFVNRALTEERITPQTSCLCRIRDGDNKGHYELGTYFFIRPKSKLLLWIRLQGVDKQTSEGG